MAGRARSGSLARLNAAEQPVIPCPPLGDRRLPTRHDRIRSSVPRFFVCLLPQRLLRCHPLDRFPRPSTYLAPTYRVVLSGCCELAESDFYFCRLSVAPMRGGPVGRAHGDAVSSAETPALPIGQEVDARCRLHEIDFVWSATRILRRSYGVVPPQIP